MKTKARAIEREKRGIDVNFKMATSPDMALSVAFELQHLPAELVLQLQVAHGVPVGAPTVLQDITTLSCRV